MYTHPQELPSIAGGMFRLGSASCQLGLCLFDSLRVHSGAHCIYIIRVVQRGSRGVSLGLRHTSRARVEALGEQPGRQVGCAQLQKGGHAGLKGVDVELDLRAQQAPHVEHDAPGAVDAGGVELPILVVLPLLDACNLQAHRGSGHRLRALNKHEATRSLLAEQVASTRWANPPLIRLNVSIGLEHAMQDPLDGAACWGRIIVPEG